MYNRLIVISIVAIFCFSSIATPEVLASSANTASQKEESWTQAFQVQMKDIAIALALLAGAAVVIKGPGLVHNYFGIPPEVAAQSKKCCEGHSHSHQH